MRLPSVGLHGSDKRITEIRAVPDSELVGFKKVTLELIDWADFMHEVWPAIQGKSGLPRSC